MVIYSVYMEAATMFIYEKQWFDSKHPYTSYVETNLNHPLHFHSVFEINYILSGEINITIDNSTYRLKEGDALIIFPHQLHSYVTEFSSSMQVILFSPELVGRFAMQYKNKIPVNCMLSDLSVYRNDFESENPLIQKGMLYSILGRLTENTALKDAEYSSDFLLLHKMLLFIEDNYANECSLKEVSLTLNYGYSYLSRIFKQCMNMSYTEYLNRYRISKAVYLLTQYRTTSVLDISSQCGFNNICSFNRNFKRYTGTTPSNIIESPSLL